MSLERVKRLTSRFREQLTSVPDDCNAWSHGTELGVELVESMLRARHLDVAAHELRKRGVGHYTICSTGHESNVVLGRLTSPKDPTIVHYRSAALQVERARQVPGRHPVQDIALSLVAARTEPTSGGRHKVFGGKDLGIIPSTSTIASHMPRAVGLAIALERVMRLELPHELDPDSIVMASFGDASLNHSTAIGALNAAGWVVHQKLKLPLLVVCEDNGLGISVRTPTGWVEERLRSLPHIAYHSADGTDLNQCYRTARDAIEECRRTRRPQVLHLRTVRLLGHAGSDVDTVYRAPAELAAAEGADPVLHAAWQLLACGVSAERLLTLDERIREEVGAACEQAAAAPRLQSRSEVIHALTPRPAPLSQPPLPPPALANEEPLTLAQGINLALREALQAYPEALVFGEDVAKKGGVYGLTKGLLGQAGPARVFNTLLDEQTILGMALGAGLLGMLPIPEIQYLAYLHNAEDQIRGEAATMSFFSDGAYTNPMVVRIAGLAYQKGFGGHFHNDNSVAVLRDIPGIALAVPARADDALEIYRQALHLAKSAGRVVCVVEPIALYHTRDLHEEGDGQWLAHAADAAARGGDVGSNFSRARVYQAGAADLTIITYGNGLFMSLRAAHLLQERGVAARVVDLRWLAPLPEADILDNARATGRVLMVDECRQSGGISEAVAAVLLDAGYPIKWRRVASADSFIPLGDAANLVLVQEQEIVDAALSLMSLP
ncbi:MAG: MFS transporter [Polyangiaceae bacterium]|nr:MFS transporter [Polyangiaceae bacterium]MCB9609258.1 MFS transporter [Polyangiaceae bacterium]